MRIDRMHNRRKIQLDQEEEEKNQIIQEPSMVAMSIQSQYQNPPPDELS